jgi:hypothetical protein
MLSSSHQEDMCSEIDENWSSRHYISPTSLAELEETAPTKVVTVTEEIKEMASRLIAVAIESVGSERRAA